MGKEGAEARQLHSLVGQFIDEHRLLPSGSGVLAAVSGGADSVAMLHILVALAEETDRSYRLHVAHVDHGIRAESSQDAAFVADLAASLDLPIHAARIDVPGLAGRTGQSIETAARQARYDFFARVAKDADCSHVVTAHHADDNVETLLHRILRGTGLEGLRGIRPSRPLDGGGVMLVRPMLQIWREQIEQYLAGQGLHFRHDDTNTDTALMRNRIRHVLLPMLRREFNPQVDSALLRLATTAEWAGEWLDELGESTLSPLIIDLSDRRLALAAAPLARKGTLAASQAIRAALCRLGAPLRAIGMEHVQGVMELLEEGPSGRQLHLPCGLRARREYDKLVLELGETAQPLVHTDVHQVLCPGRTDLPDGRCFTVDLRPGGVADLKMFRPDKPATQEMADADKLALPLLARRWQDGDRFWPLGGRGHTKLSDYFINARIPPEDRRNAWIICDQLSPVWIAPYRIAERIKVTAHTRNVALLRLD